MTRKPRRKKVEPIVESADEPTVEPEVTTEPSDCDADLLRKQEQINALLENHPPFLGTPTARYYGETLYPWLHELEQLIG